MKLGTPDNWLHIEVADLGNSVSPWLVHGITIGDGFKLEIRHEAVIFDSHDRLLHDLAAFPDSGAETLRINASEGGWINLQRNWQGGLTISARICRFASSSAYEASFEVPGEFTREVCRGLRRVLVRDEA